jgi:hypothetical protein
MGTTQEVFDGDPETLIRSTEANPLQVQVTFPVIQTINGVSVKVGGVASEVVVTIKSTLDGEPTSYILTAPQSPDPKWMDFDFDSPQEVIWVEVAVRSVYDDEPAHVHVWEISFRQEPRP